MKIAIEFDPAIVEELAERLVAHHLHAYREAVANAYDADSEKVIITHTPETITFEDYGSGASDVAAFCKIGAPTKREITETPIHKRKPIGQKGLGFLSYFKLGRTVTILINNGIIGYKIVRDTQNPLVAEAINGPVNSFLEHQGVKVEITNLKRAVDPEELAAYLKRYFPLIMSRGFQIIMNGKELSHKDLEPKTILSTKYGRIVGNFTHHGAGVADVYCRGLFVCKLLVDATRHFTAWVDCDFIIPEAGRENFVKDNDEWQAFFEAVKKQGQFYPRAHGTIEPKHETSIKRLLQALGTVTKEMGLRVEGEMPQSPRKSTPTVEGETGQEPTHEQKPKESKLTQKTVPEYDKMHTYKSGHIGKILKTDYGIQFQWAHLEGELSPIVPQTPNVLVWNYSSEITKRIMAYNKRSRGGTIIPISIPYVARAYAQLLIKDPPQKTVDLIASGLYKKLVRINTTPILTETTQETWR